MGFRVSEFRVWGGAGERGGFSGKGCTSLGVGLGLRLIILVITIIFTIVLIITIISLGLWASVQVCETLNPTP